MTCASCQAHVEKAVAGVPGVTGVSVSLLTNSMGVEGTASDADIIKAVEDAGYGASVKGAAQAKQGVAEKLAADEEALKDHETPSASAGGCYLPWALPCSCTSPWAQHAGVAGAALLDGNHLGLMLYPDAPWPLSSCTSTRTFTSGFKTLFHGAP